MVQVASQKETYLAELAADLAARPSRIVSESPSWVHRVRDEGERRFQELDFPTTKDEDWKYTNVAPLLRIPFHTPRGRHLLSARDIEGFDYRAADWAQIVFVDGRYQAGLSSMTALPDGIIAGELSAALTSSAGPELQAAATAAETHLGRLARPHRQAFVALNAAFLEEVAFVSVPNDRIVDVPIHLLFVTAARDDDEDRDAKATHPRVLVVLGRMASATVIESYVSLGETATFSNAVSEIALDAGASLAHYQLFREGDRAFHIGTTQALQGRDSSLTSFSVAMGGKLVRNDLNVLLAAEGASCALNGLYVASGTQHVDNHTAIDHAHAHGTSRQVYKGILDGRARAVFNGKVFVRPGAAATDAQQTNRNLILSDEALVDTKPQLEIFDDDVKCNHGASIGQIDEEQVFYMRSRGLDDQRARALLAFGFASEVTSRMKVDPIRVELDRLLLERLAYEGDAEDLA